MKTTSILTTLFVSVALAEDQLPFAEKAAGWFDKAKSFIPSVTPSIPNPVNAAAAGIAASKVQQITRANYRSILAPKASGEEEWLVYLTGGNKTCFGRCDKVDRVFNVSLFREQVASLTAPGIRTSTCSSTTTSRNTTSKDWKD